jgi:hypothetical protein
MTCKCYDISLRVNVKRFKYRQYIEQLSIILDTLNSSNLSSKVQIPQINKNYTAMLHSNTVVKKTKKFIQQTLNFETNMYKLSFKHCSICHQRQLNMKTSNRICSRCQNRKNEMFYSYENKLLPTWKTKNNIMARKGVYLEVLVFAVCRTVSEFSFYQTVSFSAKNCTIKLVFRCAIIF